MNSRTGARMRRRIRGTRHEGDEKSNESERQSRVGEEIIDARADFLQIRDSSLEPRVIPYRGSPITKHRAEDFARRSRATGLSGSDVAARVRWRSKRPTRSDVKDEGDGLKKSRKESQDGDEGDAFTLHDESQILSFMKKSREPKFAATPNPQNTQPWQSRERTLSFLSMGQLYQRAFFKVCRKSEARNKVLTGKSVLSQDFFFCVGTRNPGKAVQGGKGGEKRFVPAFFARQGRIFMLRYRGCRKALRRSLRSYPCTGPRSKKKGRERCRPRPSKPSITQPKLESQQSGVRPSC